MKEFCVGVFTNTFSNTRALSGSRATWGVLLDPRSGSTKRFSTKPQRPKTTSSTYAWAFEGWRIMSNSFDEPAGITAFSGLTVISSYVSATRQSILAVILCSASLELVTVTVRTSLKPNGITPNSIEGTLALMVGGMARPCKKSVTKGRHRIQ